MHPDVILFWKLLWLCWMHKGDKGSTLAAVPSSLCSQGKRTKQLGCQEGCEAVHSRSFQL